MDMSVKNLVNSKFIKSVLKGSSVAELEYIRSKVFQAVDEVIAQKRQEQQDVADKQRKIIEFKKYMAKQGITVADLQVNDESPLAGKKYPHKYRYSDANGNIREWSGMGKMPRALASYINAGQSLDNFKITD